MRYESQTLLAGLVGEIMEWYDLTIYGFFAAVIAAQFFRGGVSRAEGVKLSRPAQTRPRMRGA